MELIEFEDAIHGERHSYVPSAVFYSPNDGSPSFGFEALYNAPEGTPNLKTNFKADLIDPRAVDDLPMAYRVETRQGTIIKRPQEVLEDFLEFVLDRHSNKYRRELANSQEASGRSLAYPLSTMTTGAKATEELSEAQSRKRSTV